MTIQEAYDNLRKYYGDQGHHHDYICESWQTLKAIVPVQRSTNTQSASASQIAAELEDAVRIANIGGAPSTDQISKWAQQLRAL